MGKEGWRVLVTYCLTHKGTFELGMQSCTCTEPLQGCLTKQAIKQFDKYAYHLCSESRYHIISYLCNSNWDKMFSMCWSTCLTELKNCWWKQQWCLLPGMISWVTSHRAAPHGLIWIFCNVTVCCKWIVNLNVLGPRQAKPVSLGITIIGVNCISKEFNVILDKYNPVHIWKI